MRFLRNLSVRHKITAITVFTILVVSLLSSIFYVVIENDRARTALVDELTTIARIVADNSTAALVFNDPSSMGETLSALKAKPDILGAAIFRRNGSLFASYATKASIDWPPNRTLVISKDGSGGRGPSHVHFHGDVLELAVPIVLDGEVVGTFVVKSSLDQIAQALWTYIWVVLAVMMLSLLLALALIGRLQRIISTPIEHLLKKMEEVSANQDYSLRAESHGRDELGSVIDGFNNMLAQVQRHDESLREARHQAEEASQAKSEFLANMSHELRTPLNAILGFSEIMMNEIAGPLGQPRYREYARDINESGQHLLELINDILDLSKIEAQGVEVVDSPVDIGALAEKTVHLVADLAEQAGIEIRVLAESNLPKLIADERLVRQALLNLVSNAVKFTPRGGRVEVDLSVATDRTFCIRVCDTGIGIAESEIERVLEPFCQVESTRSRDYQGTGLGLPISKSFVELHEGSFELKSRLGEGTQVTLRFPANRVHGTLEDQSSHLKSALSA